MSNTESPAVNARCGSRALAVYVGTSLGVVLSALLGALLSALPASCFASDSEDESALRLYYYERPPFHYTNGQGQVVGTIVRATEETLRRAGLQFQWVSAPANRVLVALHNEKEPACSPGWYSTPERRTDFLFSKATMLDKPLIALVRADFLMPAGITAKVFFAMPNMRLLVKQNFSQGAYMNGLIDRMPPTHVERVALEVPRMVRMLRADRADAIITTEAEAALFVHAAGLSMNEFKIVRFPDVPANEYRYLLCDHHVGTATVERINEAINLQGP
ncbi:MAG TPA: transporter substrate-binding domain-containing protein [Burkholderiaceae bacterium]